MEVGKTIVKIRTLAAAGAAGLAVLLGPQAVFAQEVVLTGEKCPLTVISDIAAYEQGAPSAESGAEAVEGTAAETVELDRLDVLGIVDGTYAAVTYDGGRGFVPVAEISERIPALDIGALDSVQNWENIGNGSSGETAREIQNQLIGQSYLEGEADGIFGSMSAEALTKFQTAAGLEPTGAADVFTWFLLREASGSKAEPLETAYPPEFKPEDKFAVIIDSVPDPAVLEPYLSPVWHFTYDVFEGKGELTDGGELCSWADESRPIDRLSMQVSRIVYVVRNEAGAVELFPALKVTSAGASRPYIESAAIRTGNSVAEIEKYDSVGGIEGTDVTETTILPLSESAEALLDELGAGTVIRLTGSSRQYDLEVS